RVILVQKPLVLATRHEANVLDKACCGARVEEPNTMTRPAELLASVVNVPRRHESKRQEQCLNVAREVFTCGAPVNVAVVRVAVGLEQATHEGRVHLAIVGVQDRVWYMRRPALAAVPLVRRELGETARVPPDREW